MSVRSRLLALVIALLVPLAIAALWSVYAAYRTERQAFERTMRETTRALSLVLDREMSRREAVVRTLAGSPTLTRRDLQAFHDYARTIAPSTDNAIVLADLSGQQLVNTRRPFGAPLPRVALPELRAQAGPEATVVSNLYFAPLAEQWSFYVEVPVVRDGQVIYHLGIGSVASQLQSILVDQRLPAGWLASIVDRNGVNAARLSRPEAFVGKPTPPAVKARIDAGSQGMFELVALDGERVLASFSKAPGSGWTVALGVPRQEVGAGAARAATVVAGTALAVLVAALAAAAWVGRSIARPIERIAVAAEALGRGDATEPAPSGLAEADVVAAALARAGEQIRNAQASLARQVADAVAESERAQQALLQSQKLEALGRLTGVIAHDFNNLLQTLGTSLHLADRLATDPRAKGAIESCRRAVERAAKLTRQLMSFGRTQPAQRAAIDLREELAAMRELLGGALHADIALELDCADDLWRLDADRVQLELALLNLTLNARDAMPAGGTIRILARNRHLADGQVPGLPAGDYVAVEVRDTGQGIAPDVLPRVFEPFFTTKAQGKGSGIGLAQVYGFARQFGGAASIASEVGRGTAVTMWLPRAADNAAAQPVPVPVPVPAPDRLDPPRRRGGSVLFVDDDALIRDSVAPLLREFGFEVTTAAGANEALAALQEGAVDIVFSDIVMPGGPDGVALAAEVHRRHPGLPVVLATGYAHSVPADPSLRVLSKPYDVATVAAVLDEALQRAGSPGRVTG